MSLIWFGLVSCIQDKIEKNFTNMDIQKKTKKLKKKTHRVVYRVAAQLKIKLDIFYLFIPHTL